MRGTWTSAAERRAVARECARWLGLLALCLWLGGCAAGVSHRVKPGENLYRIGKAYGVPFAEIARANRLGPPYKIRTGQKLYIPGRTRRVPVSVVTPRAVDPGRPSRSGKEPGAVPGSFAWPVPGRVTTGFGPRGSGHHDGIDIAAQRGTPVHAARDGVVIFSDKLSGYGKVVIIEHSQGYATVYAHNDRNFVRKGEHARRGQRIAAVGSTGRASGPHLHFEIRRHNVARNPVYYLARR